jgi:phospholipid/cholesterol/gamma-HCH transport system substrate-binding protein
MVSKSQKIRLGMFIILSSSIIAIVIGKLSFDRIFTPKDIYYIAYSNQSLSGIDIGSQVKYLGIPVGTVRDLHINPENLNEIIVMVALEPGTPIREDVRADLQTIGITGLKMIELSGGTREARKLAPGSHIQPGRSVTAEFLDRAETIAQKIELVLDNMIEFTEDGTRESIIAFIDEAHGTIAKVNRLLDDNEERMERTVSNVDTLTTELNRMVASVNTILQQTEDLFARNRGKIGETLDELNHTAQYLNNTARMINSDPSILVRGIRHNNVPDNRLYE